MRESSYNLKLHSHTPKRFRGGERKVMKKSLSLVVALAMVFSLLVPAMAFAATAQEEAAGNTLKELGVLKGNEQGDLMLDKELTRQEMIILLSRLLGVEDEAKNHANTHGWPDVANSDFDGYISWAKENGLTKGVEDGSVFGYDQALTVEQLLQFLLRALGYTDVAWDDVASTAVELGLVAAGTDVKAVAKRGTMAVVTLTTLDTNVNGENVTLGAKLGLPGYEVGAVAIASFKAVGKKKLEVTFNKSVDKDKAKVSLKRGTNSVSIDKTTWNDANTVVTIDTVSNLFEGTYEVTVSGVADNNLTASVAVQNEKVTSIEILNDVAPISRDATGADVTNQVTVNYVVKNQYGEEMNPSLQATSTVMGTTQAASGVVTITKQSGTPPTAVPFNYEEKFVLTLIHQESATSVTKELKVGLSAKVSNVNIVGLYHKDDATLSEDTTNVGDFKLVVEALDQYGNKMTKPALVKKDVIVTNTNTNVISLDGYATVNGVTTANFSYEELDGSNKLFLTLAGTPKAGSTTITLIALSNGNSANYVVNVAEGKVYDQVILNPVDGIVGAGEEFRVPVTVLDKHGNAVTDAKELNDAADPAKHSNQPPIKLNPQGKFVKDGDNLYLEYTAPESEGIMTVTALSESNKYTHQVITVRAAAEPRVITGLKDVNSLVFYNDTLEIGVGNLVVEDQYGRVIPKDTLEKLLDTSKSDYFTIQATNGGEAVTVKSGTLSKSATIKLEGAKKGTRTINFKIHKKDGSEVSASEYNTSIRTVVISEIESIEIADVGTIYAHTNAAVADYNKDLKVTGVTSDGQKVTLPNNKNLYNVFKPDYVSYTGGQLKIVGDDADAIEDIFGDKDDKTFTVRVVTEATGLVATKEVVTSKAAPKVESIVFKSGDDTVTSVEVNAGTINLGSFKLELKDQYGAKAKANTFADTSKNLPTPSVTFSNIKAGSGNNTPAVSNNGSSNASIVAAAGDSFTVTVQYGDASASVEVTVVQP